jgi:Na+-driven multidrug efflux pump
MLIRGVGPFPKLGIAGSACSTLIGQGVSLVCLVVTLYRMKSPLMLRWEDLPQLKPDLRIASQLLLRGLPMGLQMLVMSGAAMVMISFVNSFGAVTAAAYTAASQVWTYVQMPAMALGASISSMAAQNIGADRWDRVGKVAVSGVLCSLVVTGAIAGLIYLAGDIPLRLFLGSSSAAMPIARHINQTVLWSLTLFSVTFALSGIVRSTGAVIVPLLILAFSVGVIRIPFAMVLIPRWQADAIWWSFPLGTIVSAGLSLVYYRYGGWRKLRMLKFESEPGGEASDTGMGAPAMDIPIEDDEAEEIQADRAAAAKAGAPA